MFQVPFKKEHVFSWQKHKTSVLESLENDLDFSMSKHVPYVTSYSDKNLGKFQQFFNIIGKYVDSNRVVECWYQKYTRGEYHSLHNHGPIGWSAIFYATLGEGHKGTTFYSPFPDIDGSLVHRTPSVMEGDLLIFPSYLCHCFNPSDSDEERAVIAFNMK